MSRRRRGSRRSADELPLFDSGSEPLDSDSEPLDLPTAPPDDDTAIDEGQADAADPPTDARPEPASSDEADEPQADEPDDGAERAERPERAPGATSEEGPAGSSRSLLARRFRAGLIDLGVIVGVVATTALLARSLGADVGLDDWPPFVLLGLLFSYLYTVVPLAFWGQTPGMRSSHIVARGRDGLPLTVEQASRRWLGSLLGLIVLGLPIALARRGRALPEVISRSELRGTEIDDDRPPPNERA